MSLKDAAAIQDAIDSAPSAGGIIDIGAGVWPAGEPLSIRNKSGLTLRGCGGLPTSETGTIVRADRKLPKLLDLDGATRCTLEGISFDGMDLTGIGVHVHNSPGVLATGNLTFRDCRIFRCAAGIQTGILGENQSNCSEVSVENCEIGSCEIGISFLCDQGSQWHFWNLTAHGCGVAIATGKQFPNRGGFNIVGGSFGGNRIDFDLPSLSAPVSIENLISEGAGGVFLRSDPGSPAYASRGGQRITLRNCSTGPRSIMFRQSIDLKATDCQFNGAVEIGAIDTNPKPPLIPLRIFEDCILEHVPSVIAEDARNRYAIYARTSRTFAGKWL